MSTSTIPEAHNVVDTTAQADPLRAVVEAYILNVIDTNIHQSYDAVQQTAHANRPIAISSLTTPVPFAGSRIVQEVPDGDEEDLSLYVATIDLRIVKACY